MIAKLNGPINLEVLRVCRRKIVYIALTKSAHRKSGVVKITDNFNLVPWVKEMVIGNLDLPKRRANTEIVCVEPTQIPFGIFLIHMEFPEFWNIRTFATIKKKSDFERGALGPDPLACQMSIVNVMMNNAGTARDQK